MSGAKDPSLNGLNDCGCCEGRTVSVPTAIFNRPGLSAVAYRIGRHAQFFASLLARLSTKDYPSLQKLTTREPDDPAISLLDAWAAVADVLTFYQERIANEGYLGTATERRSVLELARLLGYALSPGVAAEAYLAFTLEDKPAAGAGGAGGGTATLAVLRQAAALVPESITIPAGTRVQSIPGQDEQAQVFETLEAIEARPAWNALRPQRTTEQDPYLDAGSFFFKGAALQIQRGNRLLIVSGKGKSIRQVDSVDEGSSARPTRVVLIKGAEGSTSETGSPEEQGVYVFRVCASLFGHNAADWSLLPAEIQGIYNAAYLEKNPSAQPGTYDWPFLHENPNALDLDAVYGRIVPGSWVVVNPGNGSPSTIASVTAAHEVGASGFGLSARVTRLTLDRGIDIGSMAALRRVVVYAQSERLELADVPLSETLTGHTIRLESLASGLAKGRTIIVSGEPTENPGAWASEPAVVQNVLHNDAWTELVLAEDLANTFKLKTVTINANVAAAGHGESVQEILGSGDGSQSFQSFKLKQAPLTYRSASTPSGTETTLKVTINDVIWKEVENFLSSGPDDRHYVVRTDEEGNTVVRFGDGRNGARLPTGQNNVRAVYRKGLGLEGRVKKDRLSQLLTRSYGLKEVTNPCDAEGGDDPESLELARVNAPLKVRTLDRAVSLQDYEDFALAFAGIAKAWAIWIWEGEKKGIVLTVAESPAKSGSSGAADSALSPAAKLTKALDKAGPPFVPLRIVPYRRASFRVALRIKVLPDYQKDKVKPAVERALRAAFSFAARPLGQPVFLSEVLAAAQSVAGVEAVDIKALYRSGEGAAPNGRLLAAPPELVGDGSWAGAELLTLNDEPLAELGDMP